MRVISNGESETDRASLRQFFDAPSLADIPTESVEALSNGVADVIARDSNLDPAGVRRVIQQMSIPSLEGDRKEFLTPVEWVEATNEFKKAIEVLSPSRALQLFAQENPLQLVRRASALKYLDYDATPLHSLEELARVTRVLIDRQVASREHLVKTGWPEDDLAESPWLRAALNNLYDVKVWIDLDETEERADDHYHWTYTWSRCRDFESTDADVCPYEEAPYRDGFREEDAAKLEASRSQFFDIKIAVIGELARALDLRNAAGLWNRCLKLLTTRLTASDIDFYLRMDQARDAQQSLTVRSLSKSGAQRPGGLSDLLYVVGHYEKELSLQTLARTREMLGGFYEKEVYSNLTIANYFESVGRPDRDRLDRALDFFLSMQERESAFWARYETRVNDALANEIYTEVSVPIRVKRKYAERFAPHIASYGNFVSSQLDLSGGLPVLQLSVINAQVPTGPPASAFVRDGRGWSINLRENEPRRYKKSKGSVYVYALILYPRRRRSPRSLEVFYDRYSEALNSSRGYLSHDVVLNDLSASEEEADSDVARPTDLAREAVRTSIVRFLREVKRQDPVLADHLDAAILGDAAVTHAPDFVYWPREPMEWRCEPGALR